MGAHPPPLPDSISSANENSFARQAANACLAAPLILIALLFASTTLLHYLPEPSRRPLVLIVAAVAGLSVLVGVILGLLALLLGQPGDRSAVFTRAVIGLAISGLLAAIAVPNFVRARERALASQAALRDMHTTANDLRQQAVAALRQHDTNAISLAGVQRSLDRAANSTSGDTSLVLKATQAYLKDIESRELAYTRAAADLTSAHVLATINLVNRSDIPLRKAIVQKFLDANNRVKTTASWSSALFRDELMNYGLPATRAETAVREFENGYGSQVPLILEIRAADSRVGAAVLGILDLLDSNWGRWHCNTESGRLRFEDPAAARQYNDYLAEVQHAGADQALAQTKLAEVIKGRAAL
jgi:type II secretory pathway pseudopilin PulG